MDIFEEENARVFTVSEITGLIKITLRSNFSGIWISGEVSNFYCHNNRHYYFDLNDADSKIRVVMFADAAQSIDFKIEDGLNIKVFGSISVYEKRGEYQLIAEKAQEAGAGDLLAAIEKLRKKLLERGYFEPEHKKTIPLLPKKIGAVTSTGGAVIRDILSVLSERFDNFHLIVRNVNVQGKTSADEVCEAIDDLCRYGVDVIIIARGGGSLEDLWAFNTEKVADKVFNCSIPVISAIGHETDHTICDDVSDMRAATPSVAASFAVMNKAEYIQRITQLLKRAQSLVNTTISRAYRETKILAERKVFKKPQTIILKNWQDFELASGSFIKISKDIIKSRANLFNQAAKAFNSRTIFGKIQTGKLMLAGLYKNLYPNFKKYTVDKKNTVSLLLKDLNASSPLKAVERGYAILTDKEGINYIRSISEVKEDQEINVFLKDGLLLSRIIEKINKRLELN
ncbi:MAG: exodeoxyribonuclease VII large subunit [Actinobacteria bacterium]|nr:exodeoxyribonuclease VII large subunit [Actinomycetota bacterium]